MNEEFKHGWLGKMDFPCVYGPRLNRGVKPYSGKPPPPENRPSVESQIAKHAALEDIWDDPPEVDLGIPVETKGLKKGVLKYCQWCGGELKGKKTKFCIPKCARKHDVWCKSALKGNDYD